MRYHEVFQRMRADHEHVLREVAALDDAAKPRSAQPRGHAWPGRRVREVLGMLAMQFETHMAAEDEILYPALIEALPQTKLSIEPLRADHVALRGMLHSLLQLLDAPSGEARNQQIRIQLRDFVDLLRIHIRKEEAVVIRVAERVLRPKELQALAARMSSGSSGKSSSQPGAPDRKGDRK